MILQWLCTLTKPALPAGGHCQHGDPGFKWTRRLVTEVWSLIHKYFTPFGHSSVCRFWSSATRYACLRLSVWPSWTPSNFTCPGIGTAEASCRALARAGASKTLIQLGVWNCICHHEWPKTVLRPSLPGPCKISNGNLPIKWDWTN